MPVGHEQERPHAEHAVGIGRRKLAKQPPLAGREIDVVDLRRNLEGVEHIEMPAVAAPTARAIVRQHAPNRLRSSAGDRKEPGAFLSVENEHEAAVGRDRLGGASAVEPMAMPGGVSGRGGVPSRAWMNMRGPSLVVALMRMRPSGSHPAHTH